MSNDIFDLAYSSLSPEKKMLCVITNDLLELFLKLMESECNRLCKAIVQVQSERTALHVCAKNDRNLMAQHLIKMGADPLAKDLFDCTPLELAILNNNLDLTKCILESCSGILPKHMWGKQFYNYSDEIKILLVTATPSLFENCHEVEKYALQASESFIKSCCITGNKIEHKKIVDKDMLTWLHENVLNVQSLQNLARIAIRNAMHQNVFYTSCKLGIPKQIQQFLIYL